MGVSNKNNVVYEANFISNYMLIVILLPLLCFSQFSHVVTIFKAIDSYVITNFNKLELILNDPRASYNNIMCLCACVFVCMCVHMCLPSRLLLTSSVSMCVRMCLPSRLFLTSGVMWHDMDPYG